MDLVFIYIYIYYIFILLGRLFQTREIHIRETRIWQNTDFGLGIFKRLDYKDFLPLYAPKNSWTRKDTGHLIFSAYRARKRRFPTLNTTLKQGVEPRNEGFPQNRRN